MRIKERDAMTGNKLILNKRCELWLDTDKYAAPVAHCQAGKLLETLNSHAGNVVTAEFNTTSKPEEVASDIKKFGRRITAISAGWDATEWMPKQVRGIVIDTVYCCTLNRKDQNDLGI